MAGRSDGAKYGKLRAYHFPKTRFVDGPLQIQARIDQNSQLSSQLTLWNQQGSTVIRGNLLVIPLDDTTLVCRTDLPCRPSEARCRNCVCVVATAGSSCLRHNFRPKRSIICSKVEPILPAFVFDRPLLRPLDQGCRHNLQETSEP